MKFFNTAIILGLLSFFCHSSLIAQNSKVFPASDPDNKGGWVLNKEISDEFEGNALDPNKWFIEGQNNGDYYIWKGRAPSQFVPHNVIVEDGKLKIRSQWEPNYKFVNESYADGSNKDTYGMHEGKPLPVTTAGVITNKRFLHGYMEIKSKVGNAAITGAFWAIGYEQELDVFEQMGRPKIDGSIKENTVRTAVHDWSPPAVRPTTAFGYDETVPYRTADEFHIYGAEWGEDYLKIYRDGKLTYHVTQDELGLDWVLNNSMEVWLDSEIFKWLGVPHKEELPVDFEIEYLRVWQKPTNNLLDRAFYGFEGPILFEDNPRPLTMVPEDSNPNAYQKFWVIDSLSNTYFKINEGMYTTGVNSLEFTGYGKNETFEVDKARVQSPEGALKLSSGAYKLSLNIWLAQGRAAQKFYIKLKDSNLEIPIDLTGLPRREWVTIDTMIKVTKASSDIDKFSIELRKEDLPETKAVKFFVDDISVEKITY